MVTSYIRPHNQKSYSHVTCNIILFALQSPQKTLGKPQESAQIIG